MTVPSKRETASCIMEVMLSRRSAALSALSSSISADDPAMSAIRTVKNFRSPSRAAWVLSASLPRGASTIDGRADRLLEVKARPQAAQNLALAGLRWPQLEQF